MKIVLIGYRGTGKSVVGALVAQYLQLSCVGMDAEIVNRAGIPIPEIVEKYGWPTFRDMESEVAWDLAARDHMVIDTGGGVIERAENIVALQKDAVVIWLKASVATIVSRIQGDTQRPSLTGGKSFTEEVEAVLAGRVSKYKQAAQYEIDTDQLTPEQVADRVCRIYRR